MIDIEQGATEVEREYRRALNEFLSAPKQCTTPLRWRGGKNHPDYALGQLRIIHPHSPRIRARIVLLSHVYYEPRKYSFSLLHGTTRIVSLDVEPRRNHTNLIRKNTISSTHWSYYPCDVVIPDTRSLSHRSWLDEFCIRCNITLLGSYSMPLHDKEQLKLGL